MSRILASGSLAYDALLSFPGVFQSELLVGARGRLSVAFGVTEKAVHFGGCAGNIAYNGKLIGADFVLFGIAGHDFGGYQKWLKQNKISASYVILEKSSYTSEATVVTDQKGQQITLFHEGASGRSAKHIAEIHQTVKKLASNLSLAIISPNNRIFVLETAKACLKYRVPYFFDPGQAMPAFTEKELAWLIKNSIGLFANEYEMELLANRLKIKVAQIQNLTSLTIVTLAEKGSVIYSKDCSPLKIPAGKPKAVKDPTGCGDAYRAGFLSIFAKHYQKTSPKILEKAGRLGTKLATACLSKVGTQNHKL